MLYSNRKIFPLVIHIQTVKKRDEPMTTKKVFQLILVVAILITPFASTGSALAWSGCARYITVQWGDTLSGLAATCGTTIGAIQAANPGLGWWVYAGQVLYIPTGYTDPVNNPTYGGTYVVQYGDTLGIIAASMGVSVSDILAVNPQIWNPSLIYVGQVINLPAYGVAPVPNPPPPPVVDYYSHVKITYKRGLFVRSGPGKGYDIINSALYKTVWQYRTSSVTVDAKGQVWAEVTIVLPQGGFAAGWILVRDGFGNYFTDPKLDP
jgi:LysM repeat protein